MAWSLTVVTWFPNGGTADPNAQRFSTSTHLLVTWNLTKPDKSRAQSISEPSPALCKRLG